MTTFKRTTLGGLMLMSLFMFGCATDDTLGGGPPSAPPPAIVIPKIKKLPAPNGIGIWLNVTIEPGDISGMILADDPGKGITSRFYVIASGGGSVQTAIVPITQAMADAANANLEISQPATLENLQFNFEFASTQTIDVTIEWVVPFIYSGSSSAVDLDGTMLIENY